MMTTHWSKVQASLSLAGQAIQFMPNFKIEVKDAVTEGNKVWLFSKVTGLPGGVFKDSVDMSVWDEECKFVETENVQGVLEQGQ
jgi:hypothetical protein